MHIHVKTQYRGLHSLHRNWGSTTSSIKCVCVGHVFKRSKNPSLKNVVHMVTVIKHLLTTDCVVSK